MQNTLVFFKNRVSNDKCSTVTAKRIGAFFIDGFLFLLCFAYVDPFIMNLFLPKGELEFSDLDVVDYVVLASFIVYYIVIDSVFFTSPGKWLLRLKITNLYSFGYRRLRVLVRGILKCLVMLSVVGMLITLIFFVLNQITWYDRVLNLQVVQKEE